MDGRPYKLEDYPHNRSLHHEEVIKNEEARLMRNDEKIITISINSAPIYDSAGRMTHVVVESTDMTDRMRCEDALSGYITCSDQSDISLSPQKYRLASCTFLAP